MLVKEKKEEVRSDKEHILFAANVRTSWASKGRTCLASSCTTRDVSLSMGSSTTSVCHDPYWKTGR
jgi:hypothetical protein